MSPLPTLLLIDDDAQVGRLLQFHLKDIADVHQITAPHEGLQHARTQRPDLILLDLNMPDLDGHGVCRQLKDDPATASIPVLYLSAADDAYETAKALDHGAIDYIVKPFSPVALQARVRAALRRPQAGGSEDQSLKVLVIDDDPNIHNLMDFYLDAFAQVLHARQPKEGLRQAEAHRPDVILLDLAMPRMNGFQVCRILQSQDRTRDIPVLFLTADQNEVRAARALDSGAVDFITKPIVNVELQARIRAAVRHTGRREIFPADKMEK